MLSDQSLMADYIAGKNIIEHLESIPMATEAQAWMGGLTALGGDALPLVAGAIAGPHASALDFFLGTQLLAFDFFPLLQAPDRLTNAYHAQAQTSSAGTRLRTRLLGISEGIREREAATAGEAPAYTLLDPAQLPFHSYI